jgi:hypothetical protein
MLPGDDVLAYCYVSVVAIYQNVSSCGSVVPYLDDLKWTIACSVHSHLVGWRGCDRSRRRRSILEEQEPNPQVIHLQLGGNVTHPKLPDPTICDVSPAQPAPLALAR